MYGFRRWLFAHLFHQLNRMETRIMATATQAELAQAARDLKAQNDKARAEILAKIAALEDAIANGPPVSQELQDAFDELKASVQTDDDIVPDVPPPVV